MKIVTWNINGLRSGWDRFYDFLKLYEPDVVCLQEIKVDDDRLPSEYRELMGYKSYWYHAEKPGYSGVAIYCKLQPNAVQKGIGVEEIDREGRTITLDFSTPKGEFSISNWYFPHSSRELARLDFKLKFNQAFADFEKSNSMKNIIFCGDFNVAHQEIDIARPKDNIKNAGFTPIERGWMDRFLSKGYIDAYRKLNPEKQEFTWWSNRQGVRERNIGWRIDYFLVPYNMQNITKDCKILTKVMGSDHCPVILELK